MPGGLTASYAVELDTWALAIGGFGLLNSSALPAPSVSQVDGHSVAYSYQVTNVTGGTGAALNITVLYELQDGWTFVRKTITILPGPGLSTSLPLVVGSVSPWDVLRLVPSSGALPTSALYPNGDMGQYGVFVRWSDGMGTVGAVTNPFLYPLAQGCEPLYAPAGTGSVMIHVGYHPVIAWDWVSPYQGGAVQPLVLDAGLLSVYPMADLPGPIPPFTTRPGADHAARAAAIRSNAAQAGTRGYPTVMVHKYTEDKPGKLRLAPPRPFTSGWVPGSRLDQSAALHLQGAVLVHKYGKGMTYAFAPLQAQTAPGKQRSYSAADADTWLDASERDAFRSIAAAHMVLPPTQANRMHIPWTENDYQVDISDASQWPQYPRILQRLQDIGVQQILFAGSDYSISSHNNNTDSWGWEQTLFLSNGQHIREGYYYPSGPASLPPSTSMLVQAATAKGVALAPYVYPILGFRNASWEHGWLYPTGNGLYQSRLDSRVFQDWFVDLLVAFADTAGSRGAGFDYTFFQDGNATTYAQWAGWRRILTLARERLASSGSGNVLEWTVDNRQLNHAWSPWMWTAGSYAEPFQSDEGPYSWAAFVQDIHTDRQSGNHQRQMNYDYAQAKLCPQIALPGFIGHQSDRFTSDGNMPVVNTTLNIRDYDYYGLPYNLLSSIATGPLNHVVCGLPARDAGEFSAFPAVVSSDARANSIEFYTRWLSFTDTYRDTMLHVQPLPVQPGTGIVDGTYAVVNNSGFLFLFNPNNRVISTADDVLAADARLGIDCAPDGSDVLVIDEVWPVSVPSFTTVPCGERFGIVMEGRGAAVFNLSVVKAQDYIASAGSRMIRSTVARGATGQISSSERVDQAGDIPVLLHGSAVRAQTAVAVTVSSTGVHGNQATALDLHVTGVADLHRPSPDPCPASQLYVQIPEHVQLRTITVGSATATATAVGAGAWSASAVSSCPARSTAAPAALPAMTTYALDFELGPTPSFAHSSPIQGMSYDPSFTGGTLSGTVNVPSAVFAQLAARNASYPVPWTAEDEGIPWLLPGRLIAAIDSGGALTPTSVVTATLDGAALPVNKIWSCRSLQRIDCFSGFWLDFSVAGLQPDTNYSLALNIPAGIPAGTFQGVYYDNIDAVYSSDA